MDETFRVGDRSGEGAAAGAEQHPLGDTRRDGGAVDRDKGAAAARAAAVEGARHPFLAAAALSGDMKGLADLRCAPRLAEDLAQRRADHQLSLKLDPAPQGPQIAAEQKDAVPGTYYFGLRAGQPLVYAHRVHVGAILAAVIGDVEALAVVRYGGVAAGHLGVGGKVGSPFSAA